jgi:hypothetical protein
LNSLRLLDHEWTNGFFLECLSPIIRTIGSGMRQPAYQRILELDAITRDYPVPQDLDLFSPLGPVRNGPQMMQQAMIATSRDIGQSISFLFAVDTRVHIFLKNAALLNLHRPFFTQAVNSYETFHLNHKFAPSIYATFRSTQRTFQALEIILEIDANLSARFSMLWLNAISAAVCIPRFVIAIITKVSPNIGRSVLTRRKITRIGTVSFRSSRTRAITSNISKDNRA